MDLKENSIYKVNVFMDHLAENGLPHTKPTIIRYEKDGIIPEARRTENNDPQTKGERLYTAREIMENTRLIKNYKEGN